MSRLTEKLKNTDDYIKLPTKDKQEFINKLGKLENLEEQLGCPLEVRCKITTDTTIYDVNGNSYEIEYIHSNDFTTCLNGGFGSAYDFDFKYNEYKKTWFLKKDKSE